MNGMSLPSERPRPRTTEYRRGMELAYVKLDDAQVSSALGSVDGWSVQDGKLTKTFAFKTYKDGVVFASAVGFIADKLNHHPDVLTSYAKVTVSVNTHDVGGISPYDFELAKRIDAL
jgi:4a-hydroxytetrahydrobiopterin dehydratase